MAIPLPHLFIYHSPLELPDLFISSINYLIFSSTFLSHLLNSLTSSSPQLITSHFHLPLSLSPLELSDLFISPINYTPNFLFKSYVRFFFSFHVVSIVLLLFEFQKCVLSSLVSDWLYLVSCFYLFIWFLCSA